MTKYDTKRLRQEFTKRLEDDAADLVSVNKGDVEYVVPGGKASVEKQNRAIKGLKNELTLRIPNLKEFEKRGFTFGTPDQSWSALRAMAWDLSNGLQVRPDVALWFVTAMNKLNDNQDINELTKALGLYEHGRKRQFNKFDLSDDMAKFVEKEGMTKAEASRRVAALYGCNPETAIMWYRRRAEIYGDKE
jgi:hypothetical protein